LQSLDLALERRLIRRALSEVRGNLRGLNAAHVEAIRAVCHSTHGHDRVIVPGVDALRSFDLLSVVPAEAGQFEDRSYWANLSLGEPKELPYGIGTIVFEPEGFNAENCVNFKGGSESKRECAELDRRALEEHGELSTLAVRNWQPGDQILRPGHRTLAKIKTLFQEHKVYLWERRHWPVVVQGEEIVWVRQFGCAAGFAGSAESLHKIRLIYTPPRNLLEGKGRI
jgi:tRNA(Ile)-lysidine synthase